MGKMFAVPIAGDTQDQKWQGFFQQAAAEHMQHHQGAAAAGQFLRSLSVYGDKITFVIGAGSVPFLPHCLDAVERGIYIANQQAAEAAVEDNQRADLARREDEKTDHRIEQELGKWSDSNPPSA
jgi:hypothetical protein